jgi:hypothetical protein
MEIQGDLFNAQELEIILVCAGWFLLLLLLSYLTTKWLKTDEGTSLFALVLTFAFFNYDAIALQCDSVVMTVIRQHFLRQAISLSLLLTLSCIVLGFGLFLKRTHMPSRKIAGVVATIVALVPMVNLEISKRDYDYTSSFVKPLIADSAVSKRFAPQRIFWIILDEHPSFTSMQEMWDDPDTSFRQALISMGFTIYDSCRSSYNATSFSVASTLDASMLPVKGPQHPLGYHDWLTFSKDILGSRSLTFFQREGYSLRIISFFGRFEYPTIPAPGSFVERTAVGMLKRVRSRPLGRDEEYTSAIRCNRYNSEVIDSLSTAIKSFPNDRQKQFYYVHLLMPHWPYARIKSSLLDAQMRFPVDDDKAFHSYIKYTDSLVANVLRGSLDSLSGEQRSRTMVIIQGDHGYRSYPKRTKEFRIKESFENLNVVLWPADKKGGFYDGMSSVNTFRILLRDFYGVNIEPLKDSSENVFVH